MAQDQQAITCAVGAWTQLTNADATNVTFQVISGSVYIRYTTDATTPTATLEGQRYDAGEGKQNTALTDLVALGGAARVWARPIGSDAARVFIDHA